MEKEELQPTYKKIITFYKELRSVNNEDAEEIAKALLEDKSLLESIPTISRKNSKGKILLYRKKNSKRQGKAQKPKEDKIYEEKGEKLRKEEYLAMDFFNKYKVDGGVVHEKFGVVLDYQTPIGGNKKYLSEDPRIATISFKKRNIDLISYDEEKDIVYILELKIPTSKEPLIRSALEGYTYLKMLNRLDFVNNMNQIYPQLKIGDKTVFKAAPLIYRESNAAKQYENINDWPCLKQLLSNLEITPFIIDK